MKEHDPLEDIFKDDDLFDDKGVTTPNGKLQQISKKGEETPKTKTKQHRSEPPAADTDDMRFFRLEKLIEEQSRELARLSELVSKSLDRIPVSTSQKRSEMNGSQVETDSDEIDFDKMVMQTKREQKSKKKPIRERKWSELPNP